MRLIALAITGALLAPQVGAGDVKYMKKFGDWTSTVFSDPMTDAQDCAAVYNKDLNILYTSKDSIKISYKGRGGVEGFRYRFGKAKASDTEQASDAAKDFMVIPVFSAEVLDAPYARVVGSTVLRTAISLEISFKGLKAARADMASRCSMEPLPKLDNAPEWAKWQLQPVAQD